MFASRNANQYFQLILVIFSCCDSKCDDSQAPILVHQENSDQRLYLQPDVDCPVVLIIKHLEPQHTFLCIETTNRILSSCPVHASDYIQD